MSKRKLQSNSSKTKPDEAPNFEIANALLEIANFEKNKNRAIHKYNAYRKAAAALLKCNEKITTAKMAREIDGVGVKIAAKIEEYFTSDGKMKKLCDVRADEDNGVVQELTRVTGLGPSTALKLMREGVRSLDDLRKKTDKLNHYQKIGLLYVEEFEQRIPRSEMELLEQSLLEDVHRVDSRFNVVICGSYRRGAATSGDVDALLCHPEYLTTQADSSSAAASSGSRAVSDQQHLLDKVVKQLLASGFVTDVLSQGDFKFAGVCCLNTVPAVSSKCHKTSSIDETHHHKHIHRRIDLRLIPADQYHFALLYFTGSDLFNKRMREAAQVLGFTLNEYSLRPLGSTGVPGEPILVKQEEDIFDLIGWDYVSPSNRGM